MGGLRLVTSPGPVPPPNQGVSTDVRSLAPLLGVVVAVLALGVALKAIRNTRALARRSEYSEVRISLTWENGHEHDLTREYGLPSDETLDDLRYIDQARAASTLRLTIDSEGKLGFNNVRARVRFRRPRRPWLGSVSTGWQSFDIPGPEQNPAREYRTSASHEFTEFGAWNVRRVGLRLRLLEVWPATGELWRRNPPSVALFEWIYYRLLGNLTYWGWRRAVRRQDGRNWSWSAAEAGQVGMLDLARASEAVSRHAEREHPWWWRLDRLRLRLKGRVDRRVPRPPIYATLWVAWTVGQHAGEVVVRKERLTYHLSFSQHQYTDVSTTLLARYKYSGCDLDRKRRDPDWIYRGKWLRRL